MLMVTEFVCYSLKHFSVNWTQGFTAPFFYLESLFGARGNLAALVLIRFGKKTARESNLLWPDILFILILDLFFMLFALSMLVIDTSY